MGKCLLPGNVTNEHPVPIFILIGGNVVRAIQKIPQLALTRQILHSLGFTSSFKPTHENTTSNIKTLDLTFSTSTDMNIYTQITIGILHGYSKILCQCMSTTIQIESMYVNLDEINIKLFWFRINFSDDQSHTDMHASFITPSSR